MEKLSQKQEMTSLYEQHVDAMYNKPRKNAVTFGRRINTTILVVFMLAVISILLHACTAGKNLQQTEPKAQMPSAETSQLTNEQTVALSQNLPFTRTGQKMHMQNVRQLTKFDSFAEIGYRDMSEAELLTKDAVKIGANEAVLEATVEEIQGFELHFIPEGADPNSDYAEQKGHAYMQTFYRLRLSVVDVLRGELKTGDRVEVFVSLVGENLSKLGKGSKAVFILNKNTDEDIYEFNKVKLYCSDVAPYSINDRSVFTASSNAVNYAAWSYPSFAGVKNLDEVKQIIKTKFS